MAYRVDLTPRAAADADRAAEYIRQLKALRTSTIPISWRAPARAPRQARLNRVRTEVVRVQGA